MKSHPALQPDPSRFPAYRLAARILVVIIVCLALLFQNVRRVPASACLDRYLVRPGDTLIGIAASYGFGWRVLAELNELERPYDLYAGQWLCLPAKVGAEASASTPHPSRVPRFTASISGKWLEIETFNFPARNVYAVRVAGSQEPSGGAWRRIGTLRTKKGGELQARFQLPANLKESPRLEVCLKNATTDELKCQTAY